MSHESSRYTPQQESEFNVSRSQAEKDASKRVKQINKEEKRGIIAGLFNPDKKPLSTMDVLHMDAWQEDAERTFTAELKHYQTEARQNIRNFWISLSELRASASSKKGSDVEPNKAAKAQRLLDNLQPEIKAVAEGLNERPPFYTAILNDFRTRGTEPELYNELEDMADGVPSPFREGYPDWKDEDFRRLIKDLYGDEE